MSDEYTIINDRTGVPIQSMTGPITVDSLEEAEAKADFYTSGNEDEYVPVPLEEVEN